MIIPNIIKLESEVKLYNMEILLINNCFERLDDKSILPRRKEYLAKKLKLHQCDIYILIINLIKDKKDIIYDQGLKLMDVLRKFESIIRIDDPKFQMINLYELIEYYDSL